MKIVHRKTLNAMGILVWTLALQAVLPGLVRASETEQDLGERLFASVVDYSRIRHHRSGTILDRITTRWFAHELQVRGGVVDRVPFSFDRYRVFWWVKVNGRIVRSIPVYYEGVGQVLSASPFVRRVVAENSAIDEDLNLAIDELSTRTEEIAVFPTFTEFPSFGVPLTGKLIAFNREPELGSGKPVLLVSGEIAEEVESGSVQAFIHAEIVSGRSENVVAWFGGEPGDRPLVLTTPLSGWFSAAGERGTGIAIVLELAAILGEQFPVLVIGTSGHELNNFGVKSYLNEVGVDSPRAVMHVGASVAAGIPGGQNGELVLAPLRVVASRVDFNESGLGPVMQAAGFLLFPIFPGEGEIWNDFLDPTIPLLSTAGTTPLFHTPEDLPEMATSPSLLATVYHAFEQAGVILANQ